MKSETFYHFIFKFHPFIFESRIIKKLFLFNIHIKSIINNSIKCNYNYIFTVKHTTAQKEPVILQPPTAPHPQENSTPPPFRLH